MSNQLPGKRRGTGLLPSINDVPSQALVPVTPESSLEAIINQVRTAGATIVELLVPDGTKALQSVAGCDALRQVAEQSGIQITLFTADEKTVTAANLARLDLVPVGGAVTSPRAGLESIPPVQEPPQQAPQPQQQPQQQARPQQPQQQPRPQQAPAQQQPPAQQTRPQPQQQPQQQARPQAQPTAQRPQPQLPLPGADADDDFLAGLDAFEQAQPQQVREGRLIDDDSGGLLFDVPGDVGVRRPPTRDEDWEAAFGAMDSTMAAEPVPEVPFERRMGNRRQTERPEERSPGRRLTDVLPTRKPADPGRDPLPRLGRQERDEAEDGQRQKQRNNQLVLVLGALALVAVLGGGWLLWSSGLLGGLGNGPTLALTPPPVSGSGQEFNDITIAVGNTPISGTGSIAIRGKLIQAPASVSVDGNAEASTTTPIGLATGILTLRNTTSQPIQIDAGTQVQANGLTFTVDRTVQIPGSQATQDGVFFGRGQVSVTCTTPGAQGNLPAGTITRLPTIGQALLVDQAAFGGGSDQEVKIVRVDDVNRVLPEAMSQLYTSGVQALQQQTAAEPGWNLPATTISPTVELLKNMQQVDYSTNPPIGSVAPDGKFTLEVRSVFQAIAVPNDGGGIDKQLAGAVQNFLTNTKGVAAGSRITVKDWKVQGQVLRVSAVAVPPNEAPTFDPAFLQEVQQNIAGKPVADAQTYLEGLANDNKIAQAPTLPPEWTVVPANVKLTTGK